MPGNNQLFSSQSLSSVLENKLQSIRDAVYSILSEQFLATSIDTLAEHLRESLLIDPLVLHEDQMCMKQPSEAQIEVTDRFDYDMGRAERIFTRGHQFTFCIPFSGYHNLWHLRPDRWIHMMSDCNIDRDRSLLVITLTHAADTDVERYRQDLASNLRDIRQLIAAQRQQLDHYHARLDENIRSLIENRRMELEKLQGQAAAFNIPMIKKEGMPEFKLINIPKRITRPLPRPPATGYKPEPAITQENYEELLGIIRHAGASFEGTPQTYKSLGEEGLRDNVLSHINVVFEGKATGETFRKYGKTDIRIEEESRSAFVAECKLWGGEKWAAAGFEDTLLRWNLKPEVGYGNETAVQPGVQA